MIGVISWIPQSPHQAGGLQDSTQVAACKRTGFKVTSEFLHQYARASMALQLLRTDTSLTRHNPSLSKTERSTAESSLPQSQGWSTRRTGFGHYPASSHQRKHRSLLIQFHHVLSLEIQAHPGPDPLMRMLDPRPLQTPIDRTHFAIFSHPSWPFLSFKIHHRQDRGGSIPTPTQFQADFQWLLNITLLASWYLTGSCTD